ncbi:RluA family pseudouridine synthase [Pontivivens ytuae]|uniref:Pseudouridine synthase n=1 Tax=Pontivivens ytuae TaxID=2789856 RepID=A0A7S9LTT9_9RHOB|nr:RluA family pseudouridine synthase [Pontivivens ytuae]QPH55107.1 RluA family pseudouridine synthase [Pontivivens ytuae]
MSEPFELIAANAGRLDKVLADVAPEGTGLSRSRLRALIEGGAVEGPHGIETDIRRRVAPGERFAVTLPPATDPEPQPEDIPLTVAYEDAHLIVVDKQAGMVVHPAPGAESGTLVNALLHHCGDSLSGIGGERRPGIVHRIDKDTSGLLVVAKSDAAHQALAARFAAHDIDRRYRAICHGVPDPGDPRLRGVPGLVMEPGGVIRIETNLDRHPADRKKMAVRPTGRHAVTRARVLERFDLARPLAALIECKLETGRTHQIRVHMTHAGHALVGDPVYGGHRSVPEAARFLREFPRQALHAATLGFAHPITGDALEFESELPADMADLLSDLRSLR